MFFTLYEFPFIPIHYSNPTLTEAYISHGSGFTKLVVALWAVTMVSLYIRVQVNILGRHLYIDTARGLGSSDLPVSPPSFPTLSLEIFWSFKIISVQFLHLLKDPLLFFYIITLVHLAHFHTDNWCFLALWFTYQWNSFSY